jgi:hypothetical protein
VRCSLNRTLHQRGVVQCSSWSAGAGVTSALWHRYKKANNQHVYNARMQKWEYAEISYRSPEDRLTIRLPDLEQEPTVALSNDPFVFLNRLGQNDGWELVHVLVHEGLHRYTLKRPIEEVLPMDKS